MGEPTAKLSAPVTWPGPSDRMELSAILDGMEDDAQSLLMSLDDNR